MQTWRIQVVDSHGRLPSPLRATMRYLAAYAWIAPAVIVAWSNGWARWHLLLAVAVGVVVYAALAALHPQRQFWHDALCGTRLISSAPRLASSNENRE